MNNIKVTRPEGVSVACGKKLGKDKFCINYSLCANCKYIISLEQDGVKLIQALQKVIYERDCLEKEKKNKEIIVPNKKVIL